MAKTRRDSDEALPEKILQTVVLWAGLVLLVTLNLMPGGSLWQCLADGTHSSAIKTGLDSGDESFRTVARGGNLCIHFAGFNERDPQLIAIKRQVYYRAAYAVYPREVLLGDGTTIINSDEAIAAADRLPDDQTLREHGVRGVYQLQISAGQLRVTDREIPNY